MGGASLPCNKGLAPLIGNAVQRFIDAQDRVYQRVCSELRNGRKETHWMWFVFPQLRGLGQSTISKHFGIESAQEAQQYIRHPVLRERLVECTGLVLAHRDRTLHQIFGSPDDLKFRSCMTLFQWVAPEEICFNEALVRFCNGEPDAATSQLLGMQ